MLRFRPTWIVGRAFLKDLDQVAGVVGDEYVVRAVDLGDLDDGYAQRLQLGLGFGAVHNAQGHVLVSVGHQILIGNAAPGGQRMGAGDLEKLQLKAGALHVADLRVDAGDHGAVDDGKAKDPLIPGDARLQIGHADGKMVDAVDGDGHSTPPVQLTMEVC